MLEGRGGFCNVIRPMETGEVGQEQTKYIAGLYSILDQTRRGTGTAIRRKSWGIALLLFPASSLSRSLGYLGL